MNTSTIDRFSSDAGLAGSNPAGQAPRHVMVWIPGGEFLMGSDRHYPEEAPQYRARVDGFWMDESPVTNAEFRRFAEATGYVTFAEIPPRAEDYPGALPELLHAGSVVFSKPRHKPKQSPGAPTACTWWSFVLGADWRHPTGPDSGLDGLENHPVVHLAFRDVQAYAEWAGKELPTEAEWEFAARGGLDGAEFAWGDQLHPGGRHMANTWQGEFPWQNLRSDGYERTSPVGVFPANGYGLFDMIGNVWEWTVDWYEAGHCFEESAQVMAAESRLDGRVPSLRGAASRGPCASKKAGSCCIPQNPRGGKETASFDPAQPEVRIPRKVLKGGSHLCAPNYCRRYRPAARFPHAIDTSTNHVGFRCIVREGSRPACEE